MIPDPSAEFVRSALAGRHNQEATEAWVRSMEQPRLINHFECWERVIRIAGGPMHSLARHVLEGAVPDPALVARVDWSDRNASLRFAFLVIAADELLQRGFTQQDLTSP